MSVKKKVWERDKHHCIFCGSPYAMPNAHFLPRGSKGGLGIEQNIVTLCSKCHNMLDNSKYRDKLLVEVRDYLIKKYPLWEDSYICAYRALTTHSNYWLKQMDKKLYYDKEH